MTVVRETEVFSKWLRSLRDLTARARILVRIQRLAQGNEGDCKSVGEGVSELRIPHGAGYRVYFTRRGDSIVVLLCGGDKDTQGRDIARAKKMIAELED